MVQEFSFQNAYEVTRIEINKTATLLKLKNLNSRSSQVLQTFIKCTHFSFLAKPVAYDAKYMFFFSSRALKTREK